MSNKDISRDIGKDMGYTSMKISDFVKQESKFKKKNILDEYLSKIDSKHNHRLIFDKNLYKCHL